MDPWGYSVRIKLDCGHEYAYAVRRTKRMAIRLRDKMKALGYSAWIVHGGSKSRMSTSAKAVIEDIHAKSDLLWPE